jgi:hypothetical protein
MNTTLATAIFDNETKGFSSRLLELRSWTINEMSYPVLDVTFHSPNRKPLRVRFVCDNYNEDPVIVQLLAEDGSFLTALPSGHGVLNVGPHPTTGKPFICSPGSREYHTHPSHIGDKWENYRGKSGFDLGGLLTQIYNAWKKTVDA